VSHASLNAQLAYANGAAPRACHKTLPAAAAVAAEVDPEESGNHSATTGSCRCTGDAMRIGIAPHPATVTLEVLQQQQQHQQLWCLTDLHSLTSPCDEDDAVIAAAVNM
jgi:hypothetical protein